MKKLNPDEIDDARASTLAAEGVLFDRAKLNAMLEDLASSPAPEIPTRPQAMCYAIALPPRSESSFEYVCKTCGTHTFYKRDWRNTEGLLAELREGAVSLRAMGLDISLDESALCCKCRSAKDLDIPSSCKVVKVKEPAPLPWFKRLLQSVLPSSPPQGFQVGDIVAIKDFGNNRRCFYVAPIHPAYWIKSKDISDNGKVTSFGAFLYCQPREDDIIHANVSVGMCLKILPAKPGDPKGWVQVERPSSCSGSDDFADYSIGIDKEFLGDFSYDEPEPSSSRLGMIDWVINGRRIEAKTRDIDIMQSFLKGDRLRCPPNSSSVYPLKEELLRLEELFGTSKET